MKIIFTVEAESEYELRVYTQANDLSMVLFEYDQYLRTKLKYETLTEQEYDAYEKAREKLHELLNEHGINLDRI